MKGARRVRRAVTGNGPGEIRAPRPWPTLLFAVTEGGTVAAAIVMVLKAVAFAARSLTVLLFPLLLTDGVPRWWRLGVAGIALVCYLVCAVLLAVGTPGAYPFSSPWGESAPSDRARDLLNSGWIAETWLFCGVTAAVTLGLVMAACTADTRQQGVGRALLAVVYPVIVLLLLSELWSTDAAVVAASLTGSVLVVAVISVTVVRGGLWQLDRITGHRLAAASVATLVGAVLLSGVLLPWAYYGRVGVHTAIVVVVALLVGWAARPVLKWATYRVERVFYGRRARPHEAVRALAARLRQAPNPDDVPEQICRSAVEDLGVSGAVVSVDTTTGPRQLAAAGASLTGPVQHFALHHHGRAVGRLSVARDATSTPVDRDSDLLTLLADQAAPALAALRLAEQARAARERLVLAREEERRHLRREIHDGLGPQLAAVQLRIGTAQAQHALPAATEQQLRTAAEQLRDALAEVRRITTGLAPAALVERGLPGAVADLGQRLHSERTTIAVVVSPEPFPDLPAGVEAAAYRIVSEAVTNSIRHADPRHIHVAVDAGPTILTVDIRDDGHGLPEDLIVGTGLGSLTERAEEIGGSCRISSTSAGVCVQATLPIAM